MKKVIGIDIGGTKINSAIIDSDGNIVEKYTIETMAHLGKDEVLKRIRITIEQLMSKEIVAIGIASAGFIDSDSGKIVFAGNIDGWTGLNLRDEVMKYVNVPVYVANDANIAALCEKWLGAARGFDNFVMITMGTGLGGAIYNDKIGFWDGSNFQGAELGHIIMYPDGRECTCGQNGCAEKYIAGSALAINYFELSGEKLSGPQIIQLLGKNENADKAIDMFAQNVGVYLASIKNIFDPQAVIIGGGFINAKEYWWDKAISYFEKQCNRSEGMEVLPAEFLNDSGVIGAGKLAFDKLRNK